MNSGYGYRLLVDTAGGRRGSGGRGRGEREREKEDVPRGASSLMPVCGNESRELTSLARRQEPRYHSTRGGRRSFFFSSSFFPLSTLAPRISLESRGIKSFQFRRMIHSYRRYIARAVESMEDKDSPIVISRIFILFFSFPQLITSIYERRRNEKG